MQLLTSSLKWWEKASSGLVLSHTLTNMQVARSCDSTCSLDEIKKDNKNTKKSIHIQEREEKCDNNNTALYLEICRDDYTV